MFIKPNENGKYHTKQLPNRLMLALRAIVGFYLYYLVYGLRGNFVPPYDKNKIICIVASVFFILVATAVIIDSIRSFAIGRYQGGSLDEGVLDDDAVKNIEGLDRVSAEKDNTAGTSATTSSSAGSDIKTDGTKSAGDDDFDPHNVVYKRK